MKKRNQIDSTLLNDILKVTNQAKPQTILSIQSVIDDYQRFKSNGSKQYEERLVKRKPYSSAE